MCNECGGNTAPHTQLGPLRWVADIDFLIGALLDQKATRWEKRDK